jgi:glucosamine--fructose-6-phosphate aminotransferase (isomerizing)
MSGPIDPISTKMFREAAEASDAVQRQLDLNSGKAARIGARLREMNPRFITTVARGSSDHAACYAKYLLETTTGLVTSSTGPSVVSVYETSLKLEGSFCMLISQSGASPDLLAFAKAARQAGAYVLALVNVPDSPLSLLADEVVELQAGPETSVAATKSFIASLTAIIQILAHWVDDDELKGALQSTPKLLRQAWACDWTPGVEALADSNDLFVLGRGLGLGIAYEAALKLKEVCGLHAEAFSSAEVLHGPVTIARGDFPVLVLAQHDACYPGMSELVENLARRRVRLVTAGLEHDRAVNLPTPQAHPVIEPILRIQAFYRLANALSIRLGLNPDSPPYLNKVTSTL